MKGTCHYCNKEFSKIGILRHIKSCTSIKENVKDNEGSLVDKYILSVSSKQNPKDEWMYIGIEKDAQLKDLEQFLKDMWMKCSEDVRVFKVNGQDYINNMEIKFQDTVKLKGKIEVKFNTVCLEIRIADEIILTKKDNKVEVLANTNEAGLKDINQALKEASLEESVEAFRNDLVKDVKKENRKWSFIEKSFDLNYHLENLTKEELLTIAQNFAINKVASLKKQELKDRIIETYINKLNSFLLNMDSERFNFLVNLANKGHAYVEELNVELCVFSYFRDRGLIFTGTEENKHIIIMADEAKQVILSNDNEVFRQQLKRNEKLIKLFWGMCYYYGVISLNDFKVLVKEYVDYNLDNIDLETILKEASIYYGEFHFDGQIGSDVIVDDVNYILSEQNKKESLDFHSFKKEELLEVAQINYNGKNEAYNELHRFLTNRFSINSDMAEALIFQLEDSIKNNKEFYNIVSNFLSNFDVNSREEANEIINELYKFANNTRQWVIKGYTAQEFTHMNRTVVKEPKVGRNDPCPCGSGKKYKKCCGKNK